MRPVGIFIAAAALAAAIFGFAASAAAEEAPSSPPKTAQEALEEPPQSDLARYTCRQILLTSGEERDLTVVFMQGYFIGKGGKTTFDASKLGEATDRFLDQCISEPDAGALAVMRQALEAAYTD